MRMINVDELIDQFRGDDYHDKYSVGQIIKIIDNLAEASPCSSCQEFDCYGCNYVKTRNI